MGELQHYNWALDMPQVKFVFLGKQNREPLAGQTKRHKLGARVLIAFRPGKKWIIIHGVMEPSNQPVQRDST